MQEIEQDTAATAASVRGTLRIALPATFGRMWVAPILPAFLAAHPDVTVEAAFEDRYVDLVAESFDVAIRIGTLTDSRLVARRLAPSRRMLCAAPAIARPAGPAGRSGSPCLPGFLPPGLASALASARGRQGHVRSHQRPAGHRRCAQPVQAAVAGAGIAMVSDWLAGPELCSGKLVPVLPEHPVQDSEAIYLVHPSARLVPAKTRAYADWISAALGARPWRHPGSTPP